MDHSPSSDCDPRSCGTCASRGSCPGIPEPPPPPDTLPEDQKLRHRLGGSAADPGHVRKGGVGKSTVAVNLAVHLMLRSQRVGLLDVDIHGPSIPGMLHLEHARVTGDGESLLPLEYSGLKVMSIGFLLPNNDDAVIWRAP
jgi:hypothetical protein